MMDVNFVFRVEPRPLTTAIMARLMPAAIRPYSIAVAPDSSAKNFEIIFLTVPPVHTSDPILRVPRSALWG